MKKIYILAVAALALVACDSNDDNPVTPAKITATIGESTDSRASDTSWTAGDQIGISSSVGAVGGPYVNVKYTTVSGDGKFIGTPLFFYKPMTLTAYYPFAGDENKVSGTDGIIKASTTANYQTEAKQPDIDFLWDSQTGFTAKESNVNFKFSHKMSKLTFTFEDGPEVEDESGKIIATAVDVSKMVRYELEGLVLDGTFNTATGVCVADNKNNEENDTLKINVSGVTSGTSYSPLILFPQKPGNSNVKLHIYTDELNSLNELQHYVCTLTFGDGELKPGNNYKYTIKVTKIGLIVGQMTIEKWNTEREVNVTATIAGGFTPNK